MDIKKILESLSPNERKILPHLNETIEEICNNSGLDRVSVIRALEYLKNKGVINLTYTPEKIVEKGVNGSLYLKKGLPERRLLDLLNQKKIIKLQEIQKQSGLSPDEIKASLGVLKKRVLIEIKNGNVLFTGNKGEISKKSLEELFLEMLPIEYSALKLEQLNALKNLERRKEIIQIKDVKKVEINVTDIGKELRSLKVDGKELIEQITPTLLKKDSSWKGKKFRRYDISSPVPKISGGKRHFVNQAADYARKVWTEMGFKEMTGDIIVNSFWNFDALFTAQDHPVREMHDTFFIKGEKNFPDKKLVRAVKRSHEQGTKGSKGWQYSWNEEEKKKLVLRTHTTCLSAQTLTTLKHKDIPAKFFALGKCFRNETVDWSHSFEFNQTEGIVIDPNANFRHLLGYLKQFFKKMGFEKIRFRPAYFPYTEPSMEIDVWHPEKKVWFELGGAGIFRPEVTIPLFGKHIPVLAWGPGFDRTIMDYYKIKDLREVYKNDLTQLRKMKFWMQ